MLCLRIVVLCVCTVLCLLLHVVSVVTETEGLLSRVRPIDDEGDKKDQNNSATSNPVCSPLEPWEDPTVVYISARLADIRRPVGPNDGIPALRALRRNSLLSLERARQHYHNHYASPLYVDTNNNRPEFSQYEGLPSMHSDNGDGSGVAHLYDKQGYYKDGYDAYGYDPYGYDKDGYDRRGYDRQGYDREGYNRRGYNKQGLDRAEFNQWLKASRLQK